MDTLFKYRSYSDRSLEIFSKREVYFASVDQLNDPHDCRLSIRNALRVAIARAEKGGPPALLKQLERFRKLDHVYEKMESDIGCVGMLSLSRSATNVLMWTHYADSHRGFCVGFQLSEKFTTHRNDQGIVGADSAIYSSDNPFSDYFAEVAASEKPPEWNEFWTALLSIGMVAKAKAWEYEEEVRVIRKQPGLVPFSPAELTEVVFGMNMPNGNRDTLRQLLAAKEWGHVRFREISRANGFTVTLVDA